MKMFNFAGVETKLSNKQSLIIGISIFILSILFMIYVIKTSPSPYPQFTCDSTCKTITFIFNVLAVILALIILFPIFQTGGW
jgi:hypothetical protein